MSNNPAADAMTFSVNNHEIIVWVNRIFESEYGLRAVYKKGGYYFYIAEPSVFVGDLISKEATDEAFNNVISEINKAIVEVFSKKDVEPSVGIERVRWLLSNKTTVKDNKLKVA